MSANLDQYRDPDDAAKRLSLYVERFLTLAREGSEGDDDENAPIVDVLDHVRLDIRDLRALVAARLSLREPDAVVITREELARLQRKAGEGPAVYP